jgi:hypothetical protein
MSTDIEQRLRRELDQVTVRVPAGIVRRAHGAYRRRLAATRATAIAGTAIVVAVIAAVLAVTTTPFGAAPGGRPSPASTRTLPADIPPAGLKPPSPGDGLTTAQAARDILWEHVETTMRPASESSVLNLFQYGATDGAEIEYSANGAPLTVNQSAGVPASGAYITTSTYVNYRDHTWSQGVTDSGEASLPPLSCYALTNGGTTLSDEAIAFGIPPRYARFRVLLDYCPPGVTITRGQRIDGIAAITISDQAGDTLWLSASSYLPIQLVSTSPVAMFGDHTAGRTLVRQAIRFGYLPPTKANLAYLAAPARPAGFTNLTPGPLPTFAPITPWTPPAGAIPPFGLRPTAAGDRLTAAQASKDILWMRTTSEAIPASDTLTDDMFWYRSAGRELTYTPNGKPWDDSLTDTVPGPGGQPVSYDTVVNYGSGTWSRTATGRRMSGGLPPASCASAGTSFTTTPDAARALLACPGITVTRGQRIEGVDAIRFSGKKLGETLWVNATTYLPIEAVITYPPGSMPPAGYDSAKSPEQVFQYTWLPPTPANLAYMNVPIPAGFTRAS